LSEGSRRAAARALALPGPHAARSGVAPRGLPRPSPPGVVSADVAQESDLRGGGPGLPLVARHRRALVRATPARAKARGARDALEGAARQTAGEAAPHAAAAAERDADEVPGGVAAVPEGEPPRPDPGPDRRGAPALRRGGRALAALDLRFLDGRRREPGAPGVVLRLTVQVGVDLAAEQHEEGQEIHPQEQDDHRAE